jgi:hypothetical protein
MKCEPVLYRGIDFVLRTRRPAGILAEELSGHIHYNRVWKGVRTIVLSCPLSKGGVEREAAWFCRVIGGLTRSARVQWNACSSRTIDIGIDSGNFRRSDKIVPLELKFTPRLLEKIAGIRGELQVTVYPHERDSEE